MMILKDLKRYIESELCNLYNPYENESIAYLIIEHVFSFDKTHIILNYRNHVNEDLIKDINRILIRLKKHEPIQYIIGETEFYELKFKVTKSTLIPRQETELLVHNIIKYNESNKIYNVLDIGTGSGCIAISLAKNISSANVTAVDISEEALQIASENAEKNKTKVNFISIDILNTNNTINEKFDIIVSNPPYVTENEKTQIKQNVLNFEPHKALFVSNENPLIFYKKIISEAKTKLKNSGQLWFEINEQFGNEVSEMMKNKGFGNIKVIKDFNNKQRIIFGLLN